jgi:hypothetical protein
MGFVSLTVMVHVVGDAVSVEALGLKPEKKPPARGWQGSAKLDCVTEWFYKGTVSQ